MTILAIEAAAKICGASVYRDGKILSEERTFGTLSHSETLMPMVDTVMKACGLTMKDIDYIALTNGPGSFTGLRIGAACAKGLALGQAHPDENGYLTGGIPLVPVGTLESLAFGASGELTEGFLLVPIMDARRQQVYGAVYDTRLDPVLSPDALPPQLLADKLLALEKPCLFMGDAALLYQPFFEEKLGALYHLAPESTRDLSASVTARLAALRLAQAEEGKIPSPAIPGDKLSLRYLRKSQAEREREQRLAGREVCDG